MGDSLSYLDNLMKYLIPSETRAQGILVAVCNVSKVSPVC